MVRGRVIATKTVSTMPKYVTMIHGVDFLIQEEERRYPVLMGFYVNVYSECESPEAAESDAFAVVRSCQRLRDVTKNQSDNPPRLLVEEIAELTDWPEDCVRPMSGLIFYEPDPE